MGLEEQAQIEELLKKNDIERTYLEKLKILVVQNSIETIEVLFENAGEILKVERQRLEKHLHVVLVKEK